MGCSKGLPLIAIVSLVCIITVLGFLIGSGPAALAGRDTLYQVSTIDALQQGVFDGIQPVSELKRHGDAGIGTFDALDGEMIVLQGVVYQARADGSVLVVADTATTPFATVTYFEPDFGAETWEPMNLSTFSEAMAGQLPTENMVYVVLMHATFPTMKVRAIPAQQEPYPTLSEAAANQSVYTYSNTTGSVVGCYMPVFFEGLNVVGYHLHYLSDDRQTGGHILDLEVPAGTMVEYDITPEFTMVLPTSGDFTTVDLSQDMTSELSLVEK